MKPPNGVRQVFPPKRPNRGCEGVSEQVWIRIEPTQACNSLSRQFRMLVICRREEGHKEMTKDISGRRDAGALGPPQGDYRKAWLVWVGVPREALVPPAPA